MIILLSCLQILLTFVSTEISLPFLHTDDHLDVYKILRSNIFPQNRLTLIYSPKTSDTSAGPSGACLKPRRPHPYSRHHALSVDFPHQLLCLSTWLPISGVVLLGPNGFLRRGVEKVQHHSIDIGSGEKANSRLAYSKVGRALLFLLPAPRPYSDPLTLHGSPLLTRLYQDL